MNGYVLGCRANAVLFAFVCEEKTDTVTRDLIRNSPKYRVSRTDRPNFAMLKLHACVNRIYSSKA